MVHDFGTISWISEPREFCFHRGEALIFSKIIYVLVYGIDFHGDLTSQSLCFEDLKQVKIIENCPNHKDCRDGLGQGPGIGESVPEMALGSQSTKF